MTSFATTANGTRIAYSTAGRPWRPSLIVTHSLGSDHRMWDLQVQALKEQYHIVSIDNIGHGASDVPAGDYTVADMAAGDQLVDVRLDEGRRLVDRRDDRAERRVGIEPGVNGLGLEAVEAVGYLLTLGADINAVSDTGDTAMHGAAFANFPTNAS